jgi:chorismate-pyruvate lyase
VSRFAARLVAVAALASLTACTTASESGVARLEALLAQHDSATLALEDWCRSQGIANPRVVAYPVAGSRVRAPDDLRERLRVSASEPLGLRHVRLACGKLTLSHAVNWYVPGRMTPAMNATLASTSTPFGKVVAPLGFHRERIASHRGSSPGCPAGTRLFQRALLRLPDGRALALVEECYVTDSSGHGD